MGTPDFGLESLHRLINHPGFDIVLVVTQPDKKIGRKQKILPPPIKIVAQKHKIQVSQPKNISEISGLINDLLPDLIVVIAYGQIIPSAILHIPVNGSINVHASLLPRCRGASCIQQSIMEGDKKTGITIMRMDEGMDTGPIIHQEAITIGKNDDTGILFDKLSILSAKILPEILLKYLKGELSETAQNNNLATYTKPLKRADAKIDFSLSAEAVERFVRAMNPWPGAYAKLGKNDIKILKVENKPLGINKFPSGTIFKHGSKLAIQCAHNSLLVERLQLAGKKAITCQDFLCGHSNLIGQTLH